MGTMFGKAKNKYLADIISLRDVPSARISVRQLRKEFDGAKQHNKRLRIARAAQLAANRARATMNKRPLSVMERGEYRQIAMIYEDAAKGMFKRL